MTPSATTRSTGATRVTGTITRSTIILITTSGGFMDIITPVVVIMVVIIIHATEQGIMIYTGLEMAAAAGILL